MKKFIFVYAFGIANCKQIPANFLFTMFQRLCRYATGLFDVRSLMKIILQFFSSQRSEIEISYFKNQKK